MRLQNNTILIFFLLIAFCFLHCESPTKPKRDAPLDAEGVNYQVPDTPSITDPGLKVSFGELYTINWNNVELAKYYTVQESSDSLFVDAVTDTISGTSQDYKHYVNTLTTYYYRVKGVNGEYNSGWSGTVDIIVNSLDNPYIVSQHETIISGSEYSITWAAVDSAQTYVLQESLNSSFTNALEVTSDTTSYKTSHITESPTTYY